MSGSVAERLAELEPIVRGNTVLDALAVAIAIEESFGIVLADTDLTPEHLCSAPALVATVTRHLGPS